VSPVGDDYVINYKDLDEATALAARIPSAKLGSIEVRPILIDVYRILWHFIINRRIPITSA